MPMTLLQLWCTLPQEDGADQLFGPRGLLAGMLQQQASLAGLWCWVPAVKAQRLVRPAVQGPRCAGAWTHLPPI